MRKYRLVRRRMNARLAKAMRSGRLEEELAKIERDAMKWLEGPKERTHARAKRRTIRVPKKSAATRARNGRNHGK